MGLLQVKNLGKFRFLVFFFKGMKEEWIQKVWNVLDQFGITMPCSAIYFLEVCARVSLEVGTEGPIRGKKV